jgi:oxaloacetate decarboxylase beta subunit
MLLSNLPLGGVFQYGAEGVDTMNQGILAIFYHLKPVLPCLIFMGIGAMTDFGPLIANPVSFLMGAAAQLGIYIAAVFG